MTVNISRSVFKRMKTAFARYAIDQRGVTAVEFALVAAPFLYLMCGIMEICCMFLVGTMLDHGTMEASRRIRTNELQSSGGDAASFQKLVCDNTFAILDCGGKMFVNVLTYNNFQNVNEPAFNKAQLQFQPGGPGSIVVARVYYEWDLLTPFFGAIWSNAGGNIRILESVAAFRNEP